MKTSLIKPGTLVVSRSGSGHYTVNSRAWNRGQAGFLAKVVAIGNLRFRLDPECKEEDQVEEWEHAPKRVHILVLPKLRGVHAGELFTKVDLKKVDWTEARHLLVPPTRLHALDHVLHLEEEAIRADELVRAQQERLELVNKEIQALVEQEADNVGFTQGYLSRRGFGENVKHVFVFTKEVPLDELSKKTRDKVSKLMEEADNLVSCIREARY